MGVIGAVVSTLVFVSYEIMEKYKHIIPHILKWEGGLSNHKNDSASKNPCPVTYNGVSGYHTNRGITWNTPVSGGR